MIRSATTRPARDKPAPPQRETSAPPAALPDLITAAERGFEAAAAARHAPGMVSAILTLETAIGDWDADTDQDQGTEQARAVLRSLITRLGRAAEDGLTDPRESLRPAIEPLLALRAALRREGSYPAADTIRHALTAAGLQIRDTPGGTLCQHHPPPPPAG
jgi:cysteinyl-tRNA synthetase